MPILGAILGAVVMGLIYWIMWGGGLAYIDARLNARGEAKRREVSAQKRLESARDASRAPLRKIEDPREAATALMIATAALRGDVTPEQLAVVREIMGGPLAIDDVEDRLSYCRYAIGQLDTPEGAVDEVLPLLRSNLDRAEKEELRTMLERVAAVHGGPTDRQERFVSLVFRRVSEA